MMLLLCAALSEVLAERQVSLTTQYIAASVQYKPRAQPVTQEILICTARYLRDHSSAREYVVRYHRSSAAVVLGYDLSPLPNVMRHRRADCLLVSLVLNVVRITGRRSAIDIHDAILGIVLVAMCAVPNHIPRRIVRVRAVPSRITQR